ncbi:MAG: rhodanese-like domain-containing protein, partial [Gemmatimonadota bacterium]|nr:rhodanese-like domain-containing protein [Gemmatimonadota bacterium]
LLVVDDVADVEVVQRHLWRIGIDDVEGYLEGGMRAWFESGRPIASREEWSVHDLERRIRDGRPEAQILDVRSDAEWEAGHVPHARHVYAPYVGEAIDELDPDRPVVVYCGSGYRSSLAASVLEANGFESVHSVPGSVTAWKSAGYPLVHGSGDDR